MIATRSQRRSTSDSTCELKKTVLPSPSQVVEDPIERLLHQRVETLGRLVQDRELGVVLERLDDADLLSHPA